MNASSASMSAGSGPDAERWIFWYLALTPLWWVLGLIVPVGAVGITWLYAMRPRADPNVTAVCWLWFSVTAAQCLASYINWSFSDGSAAELIRSLTSFSATGWSLLGMCLGVGCSYRLSAPRLVRAVCFQALWILVLSAFGFALFALGGDRSLELPSLLELAIPSLGRSGTINFGMRFFLQEDFMGDSLFRLVLFFPWSTGLALAGFTIILLAFQERSLLWRLTGFAGGLTGFVLSYSRAVFAAAIVAGGVIAALRLNMRTKLWLAVGAGILVNLALLMGFRPESGLADVYGAFTQARPGSSEARYWLYSAAWRGFLQSPWIGHGWFGQTYATWMPVVIGSHSAFYGVLYQGGVMTFAAACLAFAATLWLCLSRLGDGGNALPQAFALFFVFGITSYGENMQTLVPSLLVSFVWIGGELAARARGTADVSAKLRNMMGDRSSIAPKMLAASEPFFSE
jgi:hypothetical protein